jgi:hypothetical protein
MIRMDWYVADRSELECHGRPMAVFGDSVAMLSKYARYSPAHFEQSSRK